MNFERKEQQIRIIPMALYTILLFNILTAFVSCHGQDQQAAENMIREVSTAGIGDTVPNIGNNIRYIFQDNKDNLWYASEDEGLFKYDGKTILRFTEKHGLCGNSVRLIRQAKDGTLLILTAKTACSFNDKLFQPLKPGKTQLNDVEISNAILLNGSFCQNNSITDIQLPKTSKLTKSFSQTPYAIYCSFKDKKGNIWFGTESRGVCKYDGKTFTWLDNENLGLAVRSIFEDKNGNIWIGNNGNGLFRYDGKTLINFTKEHKLENPGFQNTMKGKEGTLARVWTISEDKSGDLWIGTIDAGLWKYDGKNLANFTVKDGLGSNSISIVFSDKKGKIWIGTDRGLTTYDGKTFTAFNKQ